MKYKIEDIRMHIFFLLTIILLTIIICETVEKIYIYRMYKNLSPEQIEAFVRNAKR